MNSLKFIKTWYECVRPPDHVVHGQGNVGLGNAHPSRRARTYDVYHVHAYDVHVYGVHDGPLYSHVRNRGHNVNNGLHHNAGSGICNKHHNGDLLKDNNHKPFLHNSDRGRPHSPL